MKSHNFFLQEIVHPYFGLLWRICFLFFTIKSSQSVLCLGSSISAVSWPDNPRIHVLLEVQPIRTPAVARDSYSVDEPIREFLKSSRTGRSVVKLRSLSGPDFNPFFGDSPASVWSPLSSIMSGIVNSRLSGAVFTDSRAGVFFPL